MDSTKTTFKIKVIAERPPLIRTCRNCNSSYELRAENVAAGVDWIGNEPNLEVGDYMARWSCPVCYQSDSEWLYKLPGDWRNVIMERNNLVGDAPRYGCSGWRERNRNGI